MMEVKQLLDTVNLAIAQALANMHTVTVVKVTKVGTNTIECQPVINRLVKGKSIKLPVFVDVPPIFMQGGTSYTAHPIAVDDYGLLIISERCFDRWYDGQDGQPPLEMRMHDYSDGFYLGGVNPLAAALTIPSVIQQTGDTQFDGNHVHNGTLEHNGDTTHTGKMTRTGDLAQTGNADISGQISAGSFKVGALAGVSGSFTTVDGKTVTVTNGVITGIV